MYRLTEDRRRTVLRMAAIGLLAGALAGCRTPLTAISVEDSTPPCELMLMAGDDVEVAFFGAPELNTVQRIRPDGRISLKLAHEIRAAGKTVTELQGDLESLYKAQIQIQSISVVVRAGSGVIVSGAVQQPGRVELTRAMTALDAIMAAQGFDPDRAEVRSVIVIRHAGTGFRGYCLDMKPALKGRSGPAFYLKPNDIVYVPQTRIVAANRWVDQYINRMLPRLGIGYSSEGEMTVYR